MSTFQASQQSGPLGGCTVSWQQIPAGQSGMWAISFPRAPPRSRWLIKVNQTPVEIITAGAGWGPAPLAGPLNITATALPGLPPNINVDAILWDGPKNPANEITTVGDQTANATAGSSTGSPIPLGPVAGCILDQLIIGLSLVDIAATDTYLDAYVQTSNEILWHVHAVVDGNLSLAIPYNSRIIQGGFPSGCMQLVCLPPPGSTAYLDVIATFAAIDQYT